MYLINKGLFTDSVFRSDRDSKPIKNYPAFCGGDARPRWV